MVLMCFSEDSKDEMELTASSSLSFSLIHKEKASDLLLKFSHHIHTFSNLAALQKQSVHCAFIPMSTLWNTIQHGDVWNRSSNHWWCVLLKNTMWIKKYIYFGKCNHFVWISFSTVSYNSKRLVILLIKAVLKLCDCFSGGLGLLHKSLIVGAKLKICSFSKKNVCLHRIHLSLQLKLLQQREIKINLKCKYKLYVLSVST